MSSERWIEIDRDIAAACRHFAAAAAILAGDGLMAAGLAIAAFRHTIDAAG